MAEQIVIAELQINTKALQDSSAKLIQQIAQLKLEQKELSKETSGLTKATDDQSRKFIETDAKLKQLNSEYANNKKVLAESISKVEGLNDVLSKEATTVNEASAQNKKLTETKRNVTTATQEGRDAISVINEKINENNEYIKANGSLLEKQKIGIGDYKKSIIEAYEELENQKQALEDSKEALTNELNQTKKNSDEYKIYAQQINNLNIQINGVSQEMSKAKGETKGFGEVLNLFSGGIGGFAQQSKEAGGAGNLLKTTFKGVSEGISGATKSSLAFIATPIGAVIAALAIVVGILYSVFKSFAPVVDKVEQVMASISAVLNVVKNAVIGLVTGTKSLSETFSNLGGSMSKAAEEAAKLKKAQQELEDQQDVLEVQNAKASRQINELLLKSKDRTKSEEDRIGYLKLAQKVEEDIYKKNEIQANGELKAAQDKLIIGTGLTNQEIKLLREKGVEYAKILQDKYALDDEDIANLKSALIKKENILNDKVAIDEKAQNKINALYEKADADREKAAEKAKSDAQKAADDRIAKIKENQDKEIELLNNQLNIFIANENLKQQTLKSSVELEQTISEKKIDILKKELEFKKITQESFDSQSLILRNETAKKQTELFLSYSKAEFDLFIQENQTKLEAGKLLNQELVNQEIKRLKDVRIEKLNQLELTKGLNADEVKAKRDNNELLSTAELEFLTAKNIIDLEFKNQSIANQKALDEQVKSEKASQLQADNEIALLNAQTQLDANLLQIQQSYDIEVLQLDEKLKKQQITQEQYDEKLIQSDKKKKDLMRLAELNDTTGKLNEFKKLGEGLAGLFGKNKLIASALAGVNTALAVTEILKTPSVLPEPIASISRAVQIGTTIATGIKSVAEINGAKFEKGGLQQIGGNLHSSGGTKFVGEDGTRFEAEKGELIGVMNRNASRAFMEFNNAYPSGSVSQPNVFATGGFINQQSVAGVNLNVDYDLLASKMATANSQLPPPVVYAAVSDINYAQNNYAIVQNGANF